jgi:ElaB/YqjD/DUF883 family membrane-anchored ribosome-binding protein
MKADKIIKSTVSDRVRKIHNGANEAEQEVDASVDAMTARLASLEAQLRESAQHLVVSAREIGKITGKQVRKHPFAAFGAAFIAGVVIARALRR